MLRWLFKREKYVCPRCNYPINVGSKYCENCGQPINWNLKYIWSGTALNICKDGIKKLVKILNVLLKEYDNTVVDIMGDKIEGYVLKNGEIVKK